MVLFIKHVVRSVSSYFELAGIEFWDIPVSEIAPIIYLVDRIYMSTLLRFELQPLLCECVIVFFYCTSTVCIVQQDTGHVYAVKIVAVDTDLQEIIKEISIMQQCNSDFVVKYFGSYFKMSDLWVCYCSFTSLVALVHHVML